MKNRIQALIQMIIGYNHFLFIFSLYRIMMISLGLKEKEFKHFRILIKEDFNILDIGANIGVISFFLSKAIPKGKLFSFEPIPNNFENLEKIIKIFKLPNILPFNLALGSSSGEITMTVPIHNNAKKHGLSHIIKEKDSRGETFTVPIKTLDEIETLKEITIDAIKMDVENYEYEVFKGGEALIDNNHPLIFCELWKNEVRDQVMNFLKRKGYEILVVNEDSFEIFDEGFHSQNNFIFVHPDNMRFSEKLRSIINNAAGKKAIT